MERKQKKSGYRGAVLWITGLLLLAATGCGGAAVSNTSAGAVSESYAVAEKAMDAAAPQMEYAAQDMDAGGAITSESGIDPVIQNGRKLIKTVRLEMQTKEFDALTDGLVKKVQEMDGYIESSAMWGNSYYNSDTRSSEYTVRVPSDRLNEFIDVVGGLGNITYKNESIEDVTLQYVDVESRKKALETEQERLLELMEQAENLEDLLAIESRLSEVRYELENYGSQKRYLDNQIDYSTVYLTVTEVERITETGRKTFFEEIAERFGDSLYMVGFGVREFVIVLVGSLPVLAVWILVIAVFVLVIRKVVYKEKGFRIFRRKKAVPEATEEKKDQK